MIMRSFFSSSQTSRGFTLIELMVSVGISGVLAATSVPSYKVYLDQTRLLAGEIELTQALQSFSIQNEYSPPTGLLADLVSEGFIKAIPNDPWTSRSVVNTGAEEVSDWYYANDGKTLTLYPYSHPNRKYELASFGKAPLDTPVLPKEAQVVADTGQANANVVSADTANSDVQVQSVSYDEQPQQDKLSQHDEQPQQDKLSQHDEQPQQDKLSQHDEQVKKDKSSKHDEQVKKDKSSKYDEQGKKDKPSKYDEQAKKDKEKSKDKH